MTFPFYLHNPTYLFPMRHPPRERTIYHHKNSMIKIDTWNNAYYRGSFVIVAQVGDISWRCVPRVASTFYISVNLSSLFVWEIDICNESGRRLYRRIQEYRFVNASNHSVPRRSRFKQHFDPVCLSFKQY